MPNDPDLTPVPQPDPAPAPAPDPSPDPAPDPAPAEPAPAPDPAPAPAAATPEPKPDGRQTPWYMKRIGEQSAKLTAEQTRAATLAAENEALKRAFAALKPAGATPDPAAPAPAPAPQPAAAPAPNQQDFNAAVAAEAVRVAAAKAFDEQCNASFDAGSTAHPDFKDAIDTLNAAGAMSQELIEAALETGVGHEVLYKLGKDPDQAVRLSKLSPVKLAMEVTKIAGEVQKPAPARPVSSAPAPIPAVGGTARAGFEVGDTATAIGDWIANRNKQAAERAASRR